MACWLCWIADVADSSLLHLEVAGIPVSRQIPVFSDASEVAYGAVAQLHCVYQDGHGSTARVSSRAHVATLATDASGMNQSFSFWYNTHKTYLGPFHQYLTSHFSLPTHLSIWYLPSHFLHQTHQPLHHQPTIAASASAHTTTKEWSPCAQYVVVLDDPDSNSFLITEGDLLKVGYTGRHHHAFQLT